MTALSVRGRSGSHPPQERPQAHVSPAGHLRALVGAGDGRDEIAARTAEIETPQLLYGKATHVAEVSHQDLLRLIRIQTIRKSISKSQNIGNSQSVNPEHDNYHVT
jgi:hypothetical protein